ncbi:MAG: response regulator [Candidatus Zixiibacteriota bacterium]|nr:MAG: response regulator [candidate division Zixibacteria bacterium]
MTPQQKLANYGKTVLVVDDEADVRDIVAEMIADMGYRVQGAASGEAARDYILQSPVDLVISDMEMKGMDGLALARWVRQQFPRLPLAIMTARPTEDLKRLVRQKAVDNVLQKPFLVSELRGMVQNLTR